MLKQNTHKRPTRTASRVARHNQRRRPRRQLTRIDKVALSIVALGILGGAGFITYHQQQARAYQAKVAKRQVSRQLSCIVRTAPHSAIYSDGNEVGHADKNGNYPVNADVGVKLQVKYGKNQSREIILTRNDNGKTIQPTFDYLKGITAQHWLNRLYQCESNLANHNDQTSKNISLDSLYANGSQNTAYTKMFNWGKARYGQIQKMRADRHNHKIKPSDLTAVHFITDVDSTTLNPNGSVTMDYTVKSDLALPKKDKVSSMKGQMTLIKINGRWLIARDGSQIVAE